MSASETRGGRALSDDRGAIMVVGIFMCTCLVGALWYIAGVGDAVVYRERLQEAADATAMSTAVLHARGMNMLVMINLAMAAVLAIRVALKVLQVTLAFATILVEGCALLVFSPVTAAICAGALPVLVEVDTALEELIETTRPIIDDILIGLNTAAKGLSAVLPATTVLGGSMAGQRYAPFIAFPAVAIPSRSEVSGMPVTDGTTGRLCSEAGNAVLDLIKTITPGPLEPVLFIIDPLLQGVLDAGGAYFCELGQGGPPNFDATTNKTAVKRCDDEMDAKVHTMNEKSDLWQKECAADHVTCFEEVPVDPFNPNGKKKSEIEPDDLERLQKSTKPEDRAALARLSRLQREYDTAYEDVETFKRQRAKCINDAKKQINDKLAKTSKNSSAGGSNSNKTPRKVDPNWKNGVGNGQILSRVSANDTPGGDLLRRSPKGVRIAALNGNRAAPMGTPIGSDFSYAQAEFFYDCEGAWQTEDCNGGRRRDNEEAMWHLRWRARLRRYNAPFNDDGAGKALDVLLSGYVATGIADLSAQLAANLSLSSVGNEQLRLELSPRGPRQYELH